ncbi:MAG TPA: dockerin type I domain-containing protein, partial [Pirellulales bacterium]|nr:dockerin type I domain-containing protein [Pirellulales bacterium]
ENADFNGDGSVDAADYVIWRKNANTYNVAPAAGSIFAGLNSFSFDNGTLYYDSEFADVISPQAGSQAALNYVGGTGGGAAIQIAPAGNRGGIVMLAFPFETITTAANRTAVMDRVLDFFQLVPPPVENADFNGDGSVDAADYVIWRKNANTSVPPGTLGDANGDGQVGAADYQIWQAKFGTTPGAGATASTVLSAAASTPAAEVAPVPDIDEVLEDSPPAELAVVPQPAGALTGKIVYTSAGHGWQWNSGLNRYATDRPDYNEIVEDFGNQDQMTFFADYLLRAGATVVPMRPVGQQTNEVVLDNDLSGVAYTGAWTNSGSAIHYDEDYGAAADAVGYRFASTSATETAVATYTPNIPQAGFYPVYTWVLDGANRTNQLYRINAGGGVTEIRVDHRLVGKGWVYLGTYYFDAGTGGNVQISNRGTPGGVVIADAIRFGNGIGDFPDGPTPSGYPREDENSLQWLRRAIGQGHSANTVIGTSNVSAPSRMAEHMNAAPFGTSVYIGFHSNGTTGDPNTATARGALGLIDSDQGTPNQASLALYTGRQINQDMQALNGQFEHNWSNRTTHTFTSGFGEIDEGASAEMDMTIIEVGFHDNTQDSQLLRDPKVRDQIARSTYEAVLEYFDNFGGLTSPVSQPSAPSNVRALTNANGDINVQWTAGPTGVPGGAPTGFRVYTSRNGYGFSDYIEVAGAATTSLVIPG